jgi:hypothetical protein
VKIIAIGHRKGTGKDTFAKFLLTYLRTNTINKNIVRRGFADKLKDCCYLMYSWAGLKYKMYYEEYPEHKADVLANGKTVRQIWIEVGQWMRNYDPNIWINANVLDVSSDYLIIPDLRFPNEFELVERNGGTCLLLTNPRVPDTDDEADLGLAGWKGWHLQIENSGTLNDLNNLACNFGRTLI